jgi:origin recognition complex subunit 1
MITKKQDVIYNFFNWPHVPHSRLIVIAVANTMDLPERELSGKIRSRLGSSSRVCFRFVALLTFFRSRLQDQTASSSHLTGGKSLRRS